MIFKPTIGRQWQALVDEHYQGTRLNDLTAFKSSAVNNKITLWDPETNGLRYLLELTVNLCRQLTPEEWTCLLAMRGKEVGMPHSVRFRGETVCLDSLQAVYELCFIARNTNLEGSRIIEIGAGYGRTCHAMLSNENIASYTIVDIPLMLDLASRYLPQVLPQDKFDRILFVPLEDFTKLSAESYDLGINIDSFAEMEEEVVFNYLRFVATHCTTFYTKNPTGKYIDKKLSPDTSNKGFQLAMASGILRDMVDIHDDQSVESQAPKFVNAYRPAASWRCSANSWARPWSYFWQAFYTIG